MRFGSVCSGIEAASVAWHPLGWRAAWLAEIEPFPSSVLAHHYPEVPNLGDMTALPARIRAGEVEAPDLFCGGTPCQAFSVAGLRRSLDDARGNLSLTFCEIANAIDAARAARGEQPAIIFWENVPGVLSTKDNAFGCFLAELAGCDSAIVPNGGRWTDAGVVDGPQRTIAWRILDAQYFGLAQRRRRVFVVASARAGFDPAAVLLEWEGLRRDSAPSREAGQRATGSLTARAGRNLGQANDDVDGHKLITMAHGQGGAEIGFDCGPTLTCNHEAPIAAYPTTAHALRGEGFDASKDGTGRGTPLVLAHAFDARQSDVIQYGDKTGPLDTDGHSIGVAVGTDCYNGAITGDVAATLGTGSGSGVEAGPSVMQPVAFDTTQVTSALNRSNPKPGDPCHPLAAGEHALAIAFTQGEQHGRMDGGTPQSQNDLPTWAVRSMRRCECRSASQERGLDGSPTREPAAPLQELPHEGTPIWREVPAVREAAQGSWLLRDALPETEATRRPGIQTDAACLHCGGVRVPEPLDGLLRETRATGQARHAGDDSTHQERGGFSPMAVRRLMPIECERLMGFPDGYTAIPWRGKPASECPDGPRYKALGNSWAVPVVRWIGRRIHNAVVGRPA